jgi:hypothetical protein
MPELTQSDLLALMRPDEDKLRDEIVSRQEFEEAFRLMWEAAGRLEGHDRAQAMAYARAAQLRLARDKQTAAVLDSAKGTPARDLSALNLVELQILAYYTSLAAGEVLDMTGADERAVGVINLLRSLGDGASVGT